MGSPFLRKLARPTAVGLAAAGALAIVTLALDAALGAQSWMATGSARALLAAAFGSVVTVGAFSFWMRPVAAQLAASTVPPRLLAGHLHDEFQRRVIAATVGVLGFLAAVLLALPHASDAPAPAVSTIAGAILGVGAVASLLVAMRQAERSTRPSVVLAEAAGDVIGNIRKAGNGEPVEHDGVPDGAPAELQAPTSGWVRDFDQQAILSAVPPGVTIRLDADIGTFVVGQWTTVASVWPADAVDDDCRRRLASCVDIGDERASELDLVGSVTQFADVAIHAASGAAASPSTVYEAMWWLGAILHELVRHPTIDFPDHEHEGRTLVRDQRLSVPELAELAVDRIRQVTAAEPPMALELVRVLSDAEHDARHHQADDLADLLRRQTELTVALCRQGDGLETDIERVVRACRGGLEEHEPGSRDEEYPTDDGARAAERREAQHATAR